jgi:hypothetical protein
MANAAKRNVSWWRIEQTAARRNFAADLKKEAELVQSKAN